MPLPITRGRHEADELRRLAATLKDGPTTRRLLAIALVLEGMSRGEAARLCGMDRQTLRDWVHRYNAEGIEGLSDRPHPGRPPRLRNVQQEEIAALIRRGPDGTGATRWRAARLGAEIKSRFGVELAPRTVAKLIQRFGPARAVSPADAAGRGPVQRKVDGRSRDENDDVDGGLGGFV